MKSVSQTKKEKKKYVHVKNIKAVREWFKHNGIKHRCIQTAGTTKIEPKDPSYDNYIGFNVYLKRLDLTLIARVKRYVIENDIRYKKKIKNIPYVTKSMPEIQTQRRIFGVDISRAYWYTGLFENFISKELFDEGLKKKYSKKARLIAMGQFATQPIVSDFDGKKYKAIPQDAPDTAGIFYRCAEVVNALMSTIRAVLGRDYIFYWVDCIYFYEEKNVKKVTEILDNYGYKSQIEEIQGFFIDNERKVVTLIKGKKQPDYHFQHGK